MPNGHRRNRNSRHANTQRNIQNASVVQAYEPPTTVAEISEILVAAEEFVDNSDEIELLKSSLDSMRKGYARQQKEICKLKKEDLRVRESNDSMMDALQELDEHGLISVTKNSDGRIYCVPRCLELHGKQYRFKDVDKVLNEKEEEIEKLKTFCKSLITKNEGGIKTMIKSLQVENKEHCREDDDLVCDINYSDEESDEEDFMSHQTFIQGGKHYSYNKKFELYDDDFQFIKKFDCRLRMMAHFRPSVRCLF